MPILNGAHTKKGVMSDDKKNIIMREEDVKKALSRLAREIIEKNKDTENIVIVGIRTRGAFLAQRIAAVMAGLTGRQIPVGAIDITLYRDDLTAIGPTPIVGKTEIDFDITEKKVILIDDVLFTGRTIRSALDELVDFGRPKNIQLAVLVDRGHRELPIRADYVGKNIPTSQNESVHVNLTESDAQDLVYVAPR